ncbi:MAG: class I SAM-dependent methyltransferase [Pyrobaculum sp.]
MYITEFPAVYKYFKEYIEASGGFFELKKALDWSIWYAAKWWREVWEAGLGSSKNVFVKALYESLLLRGLIREDGSPKGDVKKPELPKGVYAREWVEMHQKLDEIGAVKIAGDEADRNALDLLYSDIQLQGWHRIMVKTFLKAVGAQSQVAVVEPYSREGHLAALYYEDYSPGIYVGYDPNPSYAELARAVAPQAKFVTTSTACELAEKFDVALLIEKMQWMPDPAKELECIGRALKQGGALYVAQPVVESMPGYLAITAALGAVHVYTWKQVEGLLGMYFKLEKRLIKTMPFYGAVWRKSG